MALTELVSNLSTGQVGLPLSATPYAEETTYPFPAPTGPGSGNGAPQDGTLFNDSDNNGIPDRMRRGFSTTGLVTDFGLKEASYNKFNLRTDSWNANSLGPATDQPFILRGLQRAGETEPQYWGGFADTISDTPRGGISAFVERDLVDKVRIGKFLLSPKGLAYSAKQFGLQVMNPNVESFLGVPIPIPAPLTNKFYNPLSPLYQNPLLGVRARRDTILPVDIGYRYGDIFTIRNVTGLGTQFNRLNLLRQETFGPIGTATGAAVGIAPGLPFLTLTSVTGPKSVFGLGITPISRYTNTSLSQYNLLGPNFTNGLAFVTNPIALIDVTKQSTAASGIAYNAARYTDLKPYLGLVPSYDPGSDDSIWSNTGNAKLSKIIKDPTSFPGNSKVLGNDRNLTDFPKRYNTVAYGQLERNTAIHDFRSDLSNPVDYPFGIKSTNTGIGKNAKDQEYKDSNLVKRIGIGDYGAINLDRSDPRYVLDNNTTVITSHKDKADQLVLGNSTKDLVQFVIQIFEDNQYKTVTRFRSYIDSVSTSFNLSVKSVFPANAVIPFDAYDRTVRQLSVDFKVPILSAVEREIIMGKLNTLAKLQYGIRSTTNSGNDAASSAEFSDPRLNDNDNDANETTPGDVSDEKPQAAPLRIKIGNFTSIGCIINSLSYDIDNETPWDIDYETPMIVNVSLQATETAAAYRADEISNFAYRQSGKLIG